MPFNCVKILKFDAGHRVYGHESKCRNWHGHEYKVEVFAASQELDSLGRVVDFSVIKESFGAWIDANLDHTMIIYKKDPDLEILLKAEHEKPFYICDFNPTAENLSKHLFTISNEILNKHGVVVKKIKLWETSSAYVEYSL